MYFQLKWHHTNLISIDATCNLIFQCMVFWWNWLPGLCEEVCCTDTCKSGACAPADVHENAFANKLGRSSARKSNSQVFKLHFTNIRLITFFYVRSLQRPEEITFKRMHCSLSICSGERFCFVQNKSSSSDMQVARTQREALHPLAGSVTGLWQILILFYCLLWLRMYRPSNDFMQEEAEGQAITQPSHTHTRAR